MGDINCGVFVGEKSGRQYTVLQSDFPLTCGSSSANRSDTGINLGPYKTKCGLSLEQPNSEDKLFCSELNEFLVRKED